MYLWCYVLSFVILLSLNLQIFYLPFHYHCIILSSYGPSRPPYLNYKKNTKVYEALEGHTKVYDVTEGYTSEYEGTQGYTRV